MSSTHPIQINNQWVPAKVAESRIEQARGHMFRTRPPDWALVFPFDEVSERSIHMLFVPFDLEVCFVVDDRIERVQRLSSWTGHCSGDAETIIELPADAFYVEPGDSVEVQR